MYSAYKLNKQGDNIQPWRTPFPIWNQSVVPCRLPDLHIGFSRGRSGGLVFPLLSEFSTVYLSFRHLKILIFICHINIPFSNNLTLFSVDILQVECHPYLNQRKLLDFCKSHDIVLVAYAALGSQRLKEWYWILLKTSGSFPKIQFLMRYFKIHYSDNS